MRIQSNAIVFIVVSACTYTLLHSAIITVELRNMYVQNLNRNLCEMSASTLYYNRTTKIPQISLLFKRDVSKSQVHIEVFQWKSNEYKKFTPLEVHGYLNTLIQSKLFDVERMCRNHWKPPLVPPLKTNVTYVTGEAALTGWPSYMPEGQWRVFLHMYQKNNENLMGSIVFEFNTVKKIF